MPIEVVAGPAGSGKSQVIEESITPGEVLIDFTALYVALAHVRRDPVTGKYPPRRTGDPLIPLVQAVYEAALQQAVERELDGYVTTASRDRVAGLEARTGTTALIIDPGERVVRERLADPVTGEISAECEAAVGRWYRRG